MKHLALGAAVAAIYIASAAAASADADLTVIYDIAPAAVPTLGEWR